MGRGCLANRESNRINRGEFLCKLKQMNTGGGSMGVPDSDLLALGKKVHKLFPDDRKDCSVYGVGWRDGEVKDLFHTACHMALMKRGSYDGTYRQVSLKKGEGPLVISNQVQNKYDEEGLWLGRKEMEKYYSFLFNDSVFADCFVTKDPSTVIKDGITVRTNRPANLVVAACIATRQAWEFPDIGRSVNRLIEFGVEPHKAHLAAHAIKVESNGKFYESYRGGHIAIYADHMGVEAVRNFLSGVLSDHLEFNMQNYREARNYNGIPRMWGREEAKTFRVDQGNHRVKLNEDPFGFIKHVGVIKPPLDVVRAIEEAFSRIFDEH